MSLDADARRLAATRPFNLLPREALQLLAFSCEKRALKAGQTLFSAGEAADGAYFLLSGEILLSAGGAEFRASPGALIGENALVAEMPRSTAATATIDSTLLRVSREMFRRILGEFPDAAVKVRANASGRMRALLNRLEEVRVRAFDVRPTPAGSRED